MRWRGLRRRLALPVAVGFGATVAEAQGKHDERYNSHWGHPTANWMQTELLRRLNDSGKEITAESFDVTLTGSARKSPRTGRGK